MFFKVGRKTKATKCVAFLSFFVGLVILEFVNTWKPGNLKDLDVYMCLVFFSRPQNFNKL